MHLKICSSKELQLFKVLNIGKVKMGQQGPQSLLFFFLVAMGFGENMIQKRNFKCV